MHTRDAFSYQMRAVDSRQRLRENDHPCFKWTTEELSLCLSRACLGKLIIRFRTWTKKIVLVIIFGHHFGAALPVCLSRACLDKMIVCILEVEKERPLSHTYIGKRHIDVDGPVVRDSPDDVRRADTRQFLRETLTTVLKPSVLETASSSLRFVVPSLS